MNNSERLYARLRFQNMIHRQSGNEFESLFTEVMTFKDADFAQVKPHGRFGDAKNDGFVESKGAYYQVYAPEDPSNSISAAVKKASDDFEGLLKQWPGVVEYYFAFNDKYTAAYPVLHQTMSDIKRNHGLTEAKVFTAKDLEECFMSLSDDQIMSIVGILPPEDFTLPSLDVINVVINYILSLKSSSTPEKIRMPDWNDKFTDNKISDRYKTLLNSAIEKLWELEEYFKESYSIKEELRKKIHEIYEQAQPLQISSGAHKEEFAGDFIFLYIYHACLPEDKYLYAAPVYMIMALFFESCDIFEEPIKRI
ncbi:hypothetical protein ACMC5R_03835 [Deferribacteres bacterium DY0037]